MQRLQDYIIIQEAYAPYKNYKTELQKLFDNFDKAKASIEKLKNSKNERTRWSASLKSDPAAKLAKYPFNILVEKTGIKTEDFEKFVHIGRGKMVMDDEKYGKYILKCLEEEKFTKDDLIKWWQEYDEKIAKAQFYDPKWLVKQVDGTKLWNPYYPNDDSMIQAIIDEPARMLRYLKPLKNRLTSEEANSLTAFVSDPVNQEAISKALKGAKNAWMKLRPTMSSAAAKHIASLIDSAEYNDGDINSLIEQEVKARDRSYYAGSNDRSCEGSAIVGIILKSLNKLYGFEIYSYPEYKKDEYDNEEISKGISLRSDVSEESLKGFLDDADYLSIEVKKLNRSESTSSGVYSSSFSTYYNYDMEVIIKKNNEVVADDTYKSVTLATSYYSGGWN